MTAKKEYTYTYENGNLIRAAEYTITVDADTEIITAKALVNTVLYVYDAEGKLIKKTVVADGTEQITYFEHHEDRTVVKFAVGEKTVTAHAKNDNFGRKEFDELQLGAKSLSRRFSYHEGEATTEHVAREMVKSSPTTQLVQTITFSDGRTISYEYDAEERITSVVESYTVDGVTTTNTTLYTYDALGQLLTETVNGTVVNTMTYDNYGNIVSKNGIAYGYDSVWKDKLTSYNGQTISYDAQGNPTSYLGHTLLWEKGRQLKTFIRRVNNAPQGAVYYTYNAKGIRTSKTIDGVRHDYILDGVKILKESWNGNTLIPLYDEQNAVYGIVYNDVPYYFLKNSQEDIIGIANNTGEIIANYTYDAWGKVTAITGANQTIAEINPFRYRGYYYDTEIGMYYLQSRYYDPMVGRFVNGDDAMYIFKAVLPYKSNLYNYCDSLPTIQSDYLGKDAVWLQATKDVAGLGHTGLAFQKGKKWHYWYWGAHPIIGGIKYGIAIADLARIICRLHGNMYFPLNHFEILFLVAGAFAIAASNVMADVQLIELTADYFNYKEAQKESNILYKQKLGATKFDEALYIKGDFSASYKYLEGLKRKKPWYNLLFLNCMQTTATALSKGKFASSNEKNKKRMKEAKKQIIPKFAYAYVSKYFSKVK